jgi:phosphatidylglycerol:prolipoprotein diacylglycerol transferase
MIDPIIFTIEIGNFHLDFRWYGVLVVLGVMAGAWIAEKELSRRGGKSELIWDGLLWVLPAAIIGARVWYVLTDILGGGSSFLSSPLKIFMITEGGLHIFGAIIFGGIAAYLFARRNKVDIWLLLDSVAPALLIGQAVARPANYINQELYGPPTNLPWGIKINQINRIPPFNDMALYPEESTRFHPTFAYEMIWNFLAAGLILWVIRRYKQKIKPGTAIASWLILAGLGRVIIESFRPDQPRIPGTVISYSRLIAGLMAIAGIFWILIRYEIIKVGFISPGPETYQIPKDKKWKKSRGES